MEDFEIIKQINFVLASRSRQDGELPFPPLSLQMLLDAVGEITRPKVKPVVLTSGDVALRLGLFSTRQGKRPGRMRDFSKVIRLGGLIVDPGEAPALGLFEYRRDIDAEEPSGFSWEEPVRQILRTDGRDWLALARNPETGNLEVAERFTLPDFDFGLERALDRYDDALFDTPQEAFGLVEFLRRAFIPRDPAGAAARMASYGRELAYWFMAADETHLERFISALRKRLKLTIAALAPELRAARILSHCILIELMMSQALLLKFYRQPGLEASRFAGDWFSSSTWSAFPVPERILEAAAKTMFAEFQTLVSAARDLDADLTRFCLNLWQELNGERASNMEIFLGMFWQKDQDWARDCLSAIGHEVQKPIAIIDCGAGLGNRVVAAVRAAPSADSIQVFEPDPVAGQILHFRLLLSAEAYAKASKPRRIVCHDSLDEFSAALLSPRHLILFCDCMPPFSSHAKPLPDMAASRLDVVLDLLAAAASFTAILRLPAEFLDGSEHAAERERLAAAGRSLWVKCNWDRERPRDRRLDHDFAIVMLQAGDAPAPELPEGYERVEATDKLQSSLLPRRLSDEYLSWPALPELADAPAVTGPVERRGLTLIDIDPAALCRRLEDYFSNLPDSRIAERYPPMMKDGVNFKAAETRRTLKDRTAFNPERLTAYPFRPFDRRFAYLHDLRPLFSDPSPSASILAGVRDNWFLVAGEKCAGTEFGVPAWASPVPCDYDFFAGRSRHFPVWLPAEAPAGRRRWEPGRIRANLSPRARRVLALLGRPDPDQDGESASLLWDFALAVLHTPAYLKAYQHVLRLGWPHLPLPGWGDRHPPGESRDIIEAYAAHGRTIRTILSGGDLEHQEILSTMATVRFDAENESTDPSLLNDAQRTLSADWGAPAKWSAVRMRDGALNIKWTEGALLKRIFELADAMDLPAADCLERLGKRCADGRINNEVCWMDIPGAAWEFTIGGRKVLRKWLSYRDFRVIQRPMTAVEMNQFSDIARRLVMLTLIGVKLDQLWPKLLEAYGE